MTGFGRRLSTLAQGLFDVQLEVSALPKLEQFVDLLEVWAEKTNLISVSCRQEIVDRHLLDSLAPATLLREVRTLTDFGSGAGFPGIPLAVLKPETRVHLIEARRRRANFLRHVVRNLGLTNAVVHEIRAEDWRPEENIEAVVGRALRIDVLARFATRVLTPNGVLVVLRKAEKAGETIRGFALETAMPYSLPGNQRHQAARYRLTGD